MSRVVFMDGKWVPESQASVSIYDQSVSQGAAAFEMTRSFNGHTFMIHEHLQRLNWSCKELGIPLPYSTAELESLCLEAQERNPHDKGDEHRLMIVVSPGCPTMYKGLEGTIYGPWVYIADFPLRYTVKDMGHYFDDGVNLKTSSVYQINSSAIPPWTKHRSRLHFYMAQRQASPDWALMINEAGYVTEGPGFNIAYVKERVLHTTTNQALMGISLSYAQECANAVGMKVVTNEMIYPATLYQADEVWVTGTPFCMLPVGCIDGRLINKGKPGPWYTRTINEWSDRVGVQIGDQIKAWDGYAVKQGV